ncbi:hypothetical protein F5Y10DRAFT_193317 [Nemania abortiva]|nr:hypothetical protein F5Y10DRAFT_193317 [Nemania abortiva]
MSLPPLPRMDRKIRYESTFQRLNEEYHGMHYFPRFTAFPPEIRIMIWKAALQRRRIIRVSLGSAPPPTLTEQETDDIRYGRSFLYVCGIQLLSKLLRVNSEARQVALKFYRVRLPCYLTKSPSQYTPAPNGVGVLPFNPEYDILQFRHTLHLTDFLSVVSGYDSRGVGLCNIAILLDQIKKTLQADDENTYERPGFLKTVSNIREFYLVVTTDHLELDDMRNRIDGLDIRQTYSPVMPYSPAFDLLRRDPRKIEFDLAFLFLGREDIQKEIPEWESVLRDKWRVDPSQIESRVLFMYSDDTPHLPFHYEKGYVPEMATTSDTAPDRPSCYELTETDVYKPAKEYKIAFGFWLFPVDAFTQINRQLKPNGARHLWYMLENWPELALAYLPTHLPTPI